jgi:ketosteroid isomerase-like protein
MRLTSLVGLVLLFAACAPKSETPNTAGAHDSPTPLSASELEAVKAVDAAFAAGMNAKDTAAVFAIYADDAKVMPPDSPILDKAGAHPEIAGILAAGGSDFVLTSTTAYGVGDLAYLVGTARFKMGAAPESVKYAEVLRKGADGKWRYVVDMFSGVEPLPPAASKPK